jgi:hypothetical protein
MTPEERADKLYDDCHAYLRYDAVPMMAAAIRVAIAEEREACARTVEATNGINWGYSTTEIAAAIRAAVAEEQEACAKIASDFDIWKWPVTCPVRYCSKSPNNEADQCDWESEIRGRVAAAIRARGE